MGSGVSVSKIVADIRGRSSKTVKPASAATETNASSSSAHPARNGAIVVDTGTGESKLILAMKHCGTGEAGVIEFHELGLAVIDMKSAAAAMAAGDTALLDSAKAAFAAAVEAMKEIDGWEDVNIVARCLGATAWYRRGAPDEVKEYDALLTELCKGVDVALAALGKPGPPMQIIKVSGEGESRYEAAAVEYAVVKSKLEPPLGVLSGGSGSVQITGQGAYVCFEAFLKDGIKRIEAEGAVRADALVDWREYCKGQFSEQTPLADLVDLMRQLQALDEPVRVVLISGFYYGAVAAGVVKKGADPVYQPYADVSAKLEAVIADPNAKVKDAVNCARLATVLSSLIDPGRSDNVQLLFGRDWVLEGKPLRTTWTAGWWIGHSKLM